MDDERLIEHGNYTRLVDGYCVAYGKAFGEAIVDSHLLILGGA
jgi:hypothetical protein